MNWFSRIFISIVAAIGSIFGMHPHPAIVVGNSGMSTSTVLETNIFNQVSGISVEVPVSATVSVISEGTTVIAFGSSYYGSFGFSTTTVKYLTDTNQNEIFIGAAPSNTLGCSVQNYNPTNGESTSTMISTIDGEPFHVVTVSNAAGSRHVLYTNYVQLFPDGTCRYVGFIQQTIDATAYGPQYSNPANPVFQSISSELKKIGNAFYSSGDMKDSISVTKNE